MLAATPISIPTLAGLQPTNNNQQSERSSNQRNNNFNNNSSLTGDSTGDQLVLGLMIVLVQLLLQQFSNGSQQNEAGDGSDNNDNGNSDNNQLANNQGTPGGDLSGDFSNRDKGLLLDAIGVNTGAGTTIDRIDDTNASGNLNGGDNLALQNNTALANHTVTNREVRDFIERRNPPGTAKLPLTAQQTTQIENRYAMEDVSIADNNGDQQISIGDFITGFQTQNGRKIQLDIPVDQALLNLLNG
ncbi:MAG: hypothetical protein ACPGVP_10675 [Thiolinea sp.]